MDVYVLVANFIDGLEDEHTDVVGVYTELEDAMNTGEEIRKNNLETFFKAYICRRRIGETPDNCKFDLVLWVWDVGKWGKVDHE